jgi:2',3'-cyclic-nucleotide 2'-phosphodiesterase (5'-nucleotidase family)
VLQYSDLENAYDDPERIARLAGLLGERRGDDTLLVGSGDDLAPGVLSLTTRGGCALPFFEAVRPDVETFGNHDFDYGLDRTLETVGDSPQQWISANVSDEGTRFGAAEGVTSSTVLETDDGRVGFIGVTDPATTDMTPAAGALDITDPIEAIEQELEELRSRAEYRVCSRTAARSTRQSPGAMTSMPSSAGTSTTSG